MNFNNSRLVDHKPMKFGTFVPYMYYMYRFVIIIKYLTNFFKLEWNLGINFTLRFFFLSVYILLFHLLFLQPQSLKFFQLSMLCSLIGQISSVQPLNLGCWVPMILHILHLSPPCVNNPKLSVPYVVFLSPFLPFFQPCSFHYSLQNCLRHARQSWDVATQSLIPHLHHG